MKRKVRNYVQVVKADEQGFDIFIKEKTVLNNLIANAYDEVVVKNEKDKIKKIELARNFMCNKYYDVRTFGAVMSTGKNAGQVRGPIQMTFARSVDPIVSFEHSITRMAITEEKKNNNKKEQDENENVSLNQTMGRKSTVPYGLYRCHGFISANLAKQTGFSEEDLQLFFDALTNMFDCDRSASRGLMSAQKLIVFRHESELGNAPANKLFDLVKVEKNTEGPARNFADYTICIDREQLPEHVHIEEII